MNSTIAQAVGLHVLTAADCAVLITDVSQEHQICYVNPAFERLIGYPAAEAIGQYPWLLLREDREQAESALLREAFAKDHPVQMLIQSYRKTGEPFRNELYLSPVRNDAGAITHHIGFFHKPGEAHHVDRNSLEQQVEVRTAELTASNQRLRREHAERRQAEELFRAFLESAPDAMVIIDRSGTMQYINAQTETLFGYTRDELIGQAIERLMPARFATHHPQHRRHFFTAPQLRPMGSGRELFALTKAGDEFPVEISLSPISTSGGMLAAAAVRDISERKRTERELQTAKHEAEQANLTKSRFLAAASHDLRQPLQTISALQAILSRTVKDTAARKHINSLASAVSTMEGMLHALLDINKLESGSITPELSDFPAASLLARLRSEFSYLANDKGLILRILPSRAILRSDPHLLQDILQNFVGNAMKYTDQGKVLVGCRRRDGWLHIEVWDTGPGIAEDERLRIFDEFYRIETPERNRKRGLGLGLAIAQRLAQLLEHPLNVRSAPGRGSMFAVAVPFGAPSDADMADITMVDPDSAEASILYIEDDPTILDAMQTLLGLEGFRVFPANTAAEAMELVTRQGCRPDLIVTDYHLPAGETGQGVISRLRQVLHDRSIPAIMVTGDNTKIRVREAAAINCLVLSKPVNPDLLVDTLRSLLDKST